VLCDPTSASDSGLHLADMLRQGAHEQRVHSGDTLPPHRAKSKGGSAHRHLLAVLPVARELHKPVRAAVDVADLFILLVALQRLRRRVVCALHRVPARGAAPAATSRLPRRRAEGPAPERRSSPLKAPLPPRPSSAAAGQERRAQERCPGALARRWGCFQGYSDAGGATWAPLRDGLEEKLGRCSTARAVLAHQGFEPKQQETSCSSNGSFCLSVWSTPAAWSESGDRRGTRASCEQRSATIHWCAFVAALHRHGQPSAGCLAAARGFQHPRGEIGGTPFAARRHRVCVAPVCGAIPL